MKYQNATLLLPDFLIDQLQDYIQGEYLYIPVKKNQRKKWGEVSGYRKKIDARNKSIVLDYLKGNTIEVLASDYFLCEEAIKKIIYRK